MTIKLYFIKINDTDECIENEGLMPFGTDNVKTWKEFELEQMQNYEVNPSIDGLKMDFDMPSVGTSTRTGTDKTVTDIKEILGSDLSSQLPEERVVNVKNIKITTEAEAVKKDQEINFYYNGPNAAEYKQKVLDIMDKAKNVWSKENYDLGTFKYEIKVPLKRKLPHFCHQHRPIHPSKLAAATEIIDKLQKLGVMQKGLSQWSSPALWVVKAAPDAPGGGGRKMDTEIRNLRLCVDYRHSNMFVRNVSCSMPSTKQMINLLSGKKFASIIDLAHGFWSLKIDSLAKKFFSVQALGNVYNFSRLPMGSLSSPAIFIACVLYSLRGLESFCFNYSDNITIVSENIDDHMIHLEMVLKRLEYYNWRIKKSKIHIAMHDTKLKLLGFYFDLSKQAITADPDKINTIINLPRPTNVNTVRKFLGSLIFYSEFIPNLQAIVAPISDLIKGKGDKDKIEWNLEAEKAWIRIKMSISADLKIHLPNFQRNVFHLVTDASSNAIASVLLQKNDEGNFETLGYYSRKLNSTESRYAQAELELMSIIDSLKHFKDIISTGETLIRTDCRSLLYLRLFESSSSKLARQLAYLNTFNHKIIFESSTSNLIKHVDYLTRTVPNIEEKLPYSKERKLEFEKLPKMTVDDLNGHTILKPEEYMPLLKQFIDKHVTNISDKDIKHVKKNDLESPSIKPFENAKVILNTNIDDVLYQCATATQSGNSDAGTAQQLSERSIPETDKTNKTVGTINLIEFECPNLDWQSIIKAQKLNPNFRELFNNCTKNDGTYRKFQVIQGVLYKKVVTNNRKYLTIMLPKYALYDILASFHHQTLIGHSGVRRTLAFAKQRFYTPGLRKIVYEIVHACSLCMKHVPATAKRRIMKTPISGTEPGQIWHVDLAIIALKRLPGEENTKCQIITCVDSYSRFCVAWAANEKYSQSDMINDFVSRVISVFGKPKGILTDGEFHTKLWHNFCNSLMIHKLRISPRSSKSNLAERMHRALIRAIKIYREQKNIKAVDWPTLLPWSTLAWNHFPNHLGRTPAELFLGRRQKAPWAVFQPLPFRVEHFTEKVESILRSQEIVATVLNKVHEYENELKEKEQPNSLTDNFPEGTWVYHKAPMVNESYMKLRPRYRGPFVVVKQFDTACLITPIQQPVLCDVNQLPTDVPKGTTRKLQVRRCDKSELKRYRSLTFFSRPLAHQFTEEFLSPYVCENKYYIDFQDEISEPDGMEG